MRISRLHVERFLGYELLDLDLRERISIFVGRNGSGKTSILDSVRAAITGTVAGVARSAAASLQHHGRGKPWAIVLDLVDEQGDTHTIRRTSTTLSRIEDERAIKLDQATVDRLVIDRPAMEALLEVGHAFDMAPAARQELVFRLRGISVTKEQLEAKGLRHPEIRDHVLRGDWKKAEREAAERKRAAAREIQEIRVEEPADEELQLKTPTRISAVTDEIFGAMRAKVASLEEQERDLVRKLGRIEGRSAASTESLERERAQLQKEIDALEEDEPPNQHWKAIEAVKEEKALRAAVVEALESERRRAQQVRDALRDTEAELERIAGATAQHVCSICGLEHEGEPQAGAVESLEATREEMAGVLEGIGETIASGEEALRTHDARIREFSEIATRWKAQDDQVVEMRKRVVAIDQQLASAQDAPDGSAQADLEQKLGRVQGAIARGREVVRQVQQYRQDRTAYENAVARRERLKKDADAYRDMEAICRPDGLRSELLASAMDPIRARIGTWAPLLDGIEISITDDFEIEVSRGGHPMRLSGSERWRVSLVLADALAQLSGIGWLCLDEMSLLDGPGRKAVTAMLARLGDDYDQVLIAAVLGEAEPRQAPPQSGVRIYRVDDGQVVPVATTGAAA